MKIVLDECLPRDLWKHLVGHQCQTVPQADSAGMASGKLPAPGGAIRLAGPSASPYGVLI